MPLVVGGQVGAGIGLKAVGVVAAHLCHNVAIEEIDALWSCEWGSGTCYHGGSEAPAAVGRICCYGIDLVRAVMVGWVFISDAINGECAMSLAVGVAYPAFELSGCFVQHDVEAVVDAVAVEKLFVMSVY